MLNAAFEEIKRTFAVDPFTVSAFFACLAPPEVQAERGKRFQTEVASGMPNCHRLLEVREPVRIVRPEIGPPILFVLLDELGEIIQVGRHWKDGRTVPCDCPVPCGSYRIDYFMRALRLSSIDSAGCHVWEPVVFCLTDQAMRTLENQIQEKGFPNVIAGTKARFHRHGNSNQGRIVVREVDRAVINTPVNISVSNVLALRRISGFEPLFNNGHRPHERPGGSDSGEMTIAPARSRNDKPRIPKGTRG